MAVTSSSVRRVIAALATLALAGGLTAPAAARPTRDRHPVATRTPGTVHRAAGLEAGAATVGRLGTAERRSLAARGVHLWTCDAAPGGGYCGTVRVPVDRAHPARGTLRLFFLFYRHRKPGPAHEAIMLSEGGPGYSVTNTEFEKRSYAETFAPIMGRRDLIMIDQRGVGRSEVVKCPALQRDPDYGDPSILRKVRACARSLGDRATVYGSGDVALDMEAVRRALRIERLDLYGASYAGQDVQSYAARFPEHVRSAVLDAPFSASVFGHPGQTFDDFGTDLALALPQVADRLCARSASCAAERSDASTDLAWLVQRLRAAPVSGKAFGYGGKLRTVTVTESSLAWTILQAGDFGNTALTEIAAAAQSLRQGDARPLLRLAAEAVPVGGGAEPARIFSEGLNPARTCMDLSYPWDTDAPRAQRLRQWRQALAALPPDRFGIFSKKAWVARPPGPLAPDVCIEWPGPRPSTPPAVPKPERFSGKVPALVITGDLDLNLPPGDSEPITDLWPNSRYVEIRNGGHHLFFAAYACAAPMIVRFIAHLRPGDTSCAKDFPDQFSFPGVGRFPVVAADAVPATPADSSDRSTSTDRQVATVATAAVTDAVRRGFGPVFTDRGRGLRGGSWTLAFRPDHAHWELDGIRYADDVMVNGKANYLFQGQELHATVAVDGPGGTDGVLRVTGVWFGFGVEGTDLTVRGRLGGRVVRVVVPGS